MKPQALIAFDLDDTLYKERDYLRSGHRVLAQVLADAGGADPDVLFNIIHSNHPRGIEAALAFLAENGREVSYSVDDLVDIYRHHSPDIRLSENVEAVLSEIRRRGHVTALITDGSPLHQRAKINALGLERFIEPQYMLISGETGADKYSPVPFALAEAFAPEAPRFYVGDNMAKDFLHPNLRGWTSVMLLDGRKENVFPQRPGEWPAANRPRTAITNIRNLLDLI